MKHAVAKRIVEKIKHCGTRNSALERRGSNHRTAGKVILIRWNLEGLAIVRLFAFVCSPPRSTLASDVRQTNHRMFRIGATVH